MNQSTLTANGKAYKLDRYGFLDPPQQWDPSFAEAMAHQLGILGGLTEEHWKIIRYIREKFLYQGTIPFFVTACADNQLRLSRFRFLFPTGYHRGACKIAGINHAFMRNTNLWLTYENLSKPENEHRVNELGFLVQFTTWNRRFAQWVVRDWHLPDGLTERHWQVIEYLQNYYKKTGTIPTIYEVSTSLEIDLTEWHDLFPEGYRRGACRAAGLPFFP